MGQYVVERMKAEGMTTISVDIVSRTDETLSVDVTDYPGLFEVFAETRPDIVMHLAAETGAGGRGGGAESLKDPLRYFRTNFVGTLNVFEACRTNKIQSVICMSSFSVYGQTAEAITEETLIAPNNPYGWSKACAEFVAKCYATNYAIKTLVFRAPLICGEGQRELNALREFVSSALNGQPITILGEGKHVREWLHPIDVAEALVRALTYLESMTGQYEVFVLGTPSISMMRLADLVVKTTGRGHIEHREPTGQVFNQFTDTRKAKTILGWKARISVEEIVRRVSLDVQKRQTSDVTKRPRESRGPAVDS